MHDTFDLDTKHHHIFSDPDLIPFDEKLQKLNSTTLESPSQVKAYKSDRFYS
jgi:hypothetical protein